MEIEERIVSSERLLVDFWATWCTPCKAMEPVFDKIEDEGLVPVLKIDADQNIELARKYEIRGVPTTILFENGVEKARVVGARPYDKLREELGL